MAKSQIKYLCQNCGYESPRWLGKCPSCDSWSSFAEEKVVSTKTRGKSASSQTAQKPEPITTLKFEQGKRLKTGIKEFDRVLGGGVVDGMVVLVAGDPGIGKSTLTLQGSHALAASGNKILYVSGEESPRQIRIRAERLKALSDNLLILSETNVVAIEDTVKELKPNLVIIDSIQTMFREDLPSAAGSVSQVRECAAYLVSLAKSLHIPIFIVGHVTKDGSVAGPRVLEHLVDTVLYFEGDEHKQFRILRAQKNRFGSTNEIGVFEMQEKGLVEISNPSQVFLSERAEEVSGSVITAALEGTRPILVEVQALVTPTKITIPRRVTTGVDYNRTAMIIAVLEKRLGLKLFMSDIYLNVAGGIKVTEPAADLSIAAAIASCFKNKVIDGQTIFVGEIGLGGEIRAVNQILSRVNEAKSLGFKKAVVPAFNKEELKLVKGIELQFVSNLREAL